MYNNLSELRVLLKRYHLSAKKNLSQNFLIDQSIFQTIIDTADLQDTDNIVEIGPGPGGLTQRLLVAKHLTSVEIDTSFTPLLTDLFGNQQNFNLVEGSALNFTPSKTPYKLIANIPYHLTGKILRHFLEELSDKPSILVLLTQKEVAQKIIATPPRANLLSNSVHIFAQPEIISIVPASSFHPQPKVDSAIIKITLYDKPLIPDTKKFFSLIKRAFNQRRKQLKSSLKQDLPALLKADIDPARRPQTLTISEWQNIISHSN